MSLARYSRGLRRERGRDLALDDAHPERLVVPTDRFHRDRGRRRPRICPRRRSAAAAPPACAFKRSRICSSTRKKSAPARSILLTNAMRGTPYLFACRQTVSVCGSTPPTEQNTATAPSSTRSERCTSIVKSMWPGVSMMLMRCSGSCLAHPFPEAGRRGGRDRDAALLFLLHPVHDGGAVMDFADPVRDPRVEQDALGRRRLAGIDVRHDADIPIPREWGLPCHVEASKTIAYQR